MIRQFLRDSAIYVVPTILSRGMGLILLPVYTRFLSSTMYGALELLTLLYVLLNLTLPLEITQSVARFLADSRDQEEKQRIASVGYGFTLVVFAIAAVVLISVPRQVSSLLLGGPQFAFEIRLAAVAMLFNALQYVIQNQLRWLQEPKFSAYVSIVFSSVSAAVAIWALWIAHMGLAGVIYGQIFGSIASLLLGHYLTNRRVPIRWVVDLALLKKMLRFSAPLVISNLGVYVATFMDRWLLNHLLGLEQVAIYSVALRFASIVSLGTVVFQMSFTPLIYSQYKEDGTPEMIDRIVGHVLLALVPLIGLLALLAPSLINLVVGARYHDSAPLIGWLSMMILLMASYAFFPGLWIAGKTKSIATINVIVAVINFAANWVLINMLGVFGAVVGTLMAAALMVGLYYYSSLREYYVPYRIYRYLAVLGSLGIFLILVTFMGSWLRWGGWLLLCAVAGIVLPHPLDYAWLRSRWR